LATVYITTIALGFILLAASIVKQLYFRSPDVKLRGNRLSAANPDPAELLRCNEDVRRLYTELTAEMTKLLGAPAAGRGTSLDRAWRTFTKRWLYDWDEVNLRCRFSELVGSKMGRAYNRTAVVHGDLPTMRLKYQSLLKTFDEEQARQLAAMRDQLDQSHRAFEKLVERRKQRGTE